MNTIGKASVVFLLGAMTVLATAALAGGFDSQVIKGGQRHVLDTAPASRSATAAPPIIATQPIATRPAAPSTIRIDQATFNFGWVWEGTPITHTFELVNTGTTPLTIRDVHSTCGCTTVGKWDKTVAQGATWHVDVKVNTSGPTGKFTKAVIVQTADADQENVRLSVEGEVRPRFETRPTRNVNFGLTDPARSSRRSVTITNNLEQPIHLGQPEVEGRALKAHLQEVEPGRKYELTIETVPPLSDGPIRSKVVMRTGIKEQPELVVQVYGSVLPRVSLERTMLLVPQPLTQEFRRRITLKTRDSSPVRITAAEPSSNDIHVEIAPAISNEGRDIWVTIAAGTVLPPTGRTITISTDDPQWSHLVATVKPFSVARIQNKIAGTQPVWMRTPAAATQPAPAAAASPAPATQSIRFMQAR